MNALRVDLLSKKTKSIALKQAYAALGGASALWRTLDVLAPHLLSIVAPEVLLFFFGCAEQ